MWFVNRLGRLVREREHHERLLVQRRVQQVRHDGV